MDITSCYILSICCDMAYAKLYNWVVDSPTDMILRRKFTELLVHKDGQFIDKFVVLGFPYFLIPSQLAFHPRQTHCTRDVLGSKIG